MSSDDDIETGSEPKKDPSLTLFLGLYLLILAFFILLNAISTIEKIKAEAVMDSLTSTFSTLLPPESDLRVFNAESGDVLQARAFLETSARLFESLIPAVEVTVVQPGQQMQAIFPVNSLYFEDKDQMRPGRNIEELYDGIIAVISSRPDNLRFEMDVLIGAVYIDGRTLPIAPTLESRRLGAFAREYIRRGGPPDSISIGLHPGDRDEIRVLFSVRPLDNAILNVGAPAQ